MPGPGVAELQKLSEKKTAIASTLTKALSNLPRVLKLLGFANLRAGQDQAIYNLFKGLDTLLLLPTGSGKSAVYIVPTLCLGYRTLIFSPLIALMKDQVETLWKLGLKAGVINSAQSPAENAMIFNEWENNSLNFLFVAPERLSDPKFLDLMNRHNPSLVVIDEAHTASAWSDSFRPDYLKIGELINSIKPKSVLALTATATPEVDEDIRRILNIQEATKVIWMPQRTNLKLSSHDYQSDNQLFRAIEGIKGQVICYCATVRRAVELHGSMGNMLKGGATVYNGKMTPTERDAAQDAFMTGNIRVMFATNAFGLGINKPDIRGVIHAEVPGSMDALYQEQGRAGRDGLDSQCMSFFSEKTYGLQMYFIDGRYPAQGIVEKVYYHMKRAADNNGIIKLTIEQVADEINSKKEPAGAALKILENFKVLDRAKDGDSVTTVKFLKAHLQDEYAQLVPAIQKIGFRANNGSYEFEVIDVANEVGLKPKKVADMLKELADNSYIQYTRPFRGKTSKLIGDISLVDFD